MWYRIIYSEGTEGQRRAGQCRSRQAHDWTRRPRLLHRLVRSPDPASASAALVRRLLAGFGYFPALTFRAARRPSNRITPRVLGTRRPTARTDLPTTGSSIR